MTEARFHKNEDSSLESSHVLEYLHRATCRGEGEALAQYADTPHHVLQELSCEETLCDSSIKSIQEIIQKNHDNIFIKALRFPRNQLSSAAAEPLAKILRITKTLIHLDIRHNSVGSEGLAKLIQPLTDQGGDRCSLVTLNLVNNNLKRKAASYLADLLKKNKTLQEVHIGRNPLHPKGMKEIINGLQANSESRVKHLDLKATGLGGKAGLKALIELLKKNETIESLDLSSNGLGPHGAKELSSVFMFKNVLLDLNLGGNDIGADGVSAMANALNEERKVQGHCNLQRLSLNWNQLGDEGAIFLAMGLEKNSTIHHLDLSHNKIGSLGALHLASTFGINYGLKEVLLNDNSIDDQGAFALASVLGTPNCSVDKITWEHNPDISEQGDFFLNHVFKFRGSLKTWLGSLQEEIKADRSMDVNWWRTDQTITDWEVATLAQSLVDHNPQMLRSIWLTGERITSQSLEILFLSYLAENPGLVRLYLKNVAISGAVTSLQKSLCTNSTLSNLNLIDCGLSAADAADLAVALKLNETLERFNLKSNNIGDEGFRVLWQVINPKGKATHKSMQAFNAGNNNLTDLAMEAIRDSGTVMLRELHLDCNSISDKGALDLARAIIDSPTLKVLSVAANEEMTLKGKQALRIFGPDRFSC